MKKEKFVFVILHYITTDDTIKCIDSIKKMCNGYNFEIVVVDNFSPNQSGQNINELYENDKKIHVILNNENLGFAKGNNVGFEFAKTKLNADFIILCNNDTYLLQKDFLKLIEAEYKESKFAVLGPRILMNNNVICAYEDEMKSLDELKEILNDRKQFLLFNKRHLKRLYYLILKLRKKTTPKMVDTSIRKENVILHGCFLIFSKEYINKFNGLDDRTFLYYEEPLLYLRLLKNNLISVYNPYLMIYHNESSSTSKIVNKKNDKINFILKNEIKSLEILIEEMKNNNY